MWTGVLAPRELQGLRNYVFEEGERGQGDGGSGDVDDDPPFCNLMDVTEGTFVTFNSSRNSICVGEVKDLLSSTTSQDEDPFPLHKELPLGLSPGFRITHLSLLQGEEFCCSLWGDRGVAVVAFEYRNSEASLHITQQHFITEKVYQNHPALHVLQCKWFPASAYKLLLILNSDYYLRVFNVESRECIGSFNFGPESSMPLTSTFSVEINPETPIDFDIGPYVPTSKSWLMFVLKPTGSVYCASLGILGTGKVCFLHTYQRIDYFGSGNISDGDEDFSHILCSKSFPVVCFTSQDKGSVWHSVMLPTHMEIDTDEVLQSVDMHLVTGSYRLFLKEELKFPSSERGSSLQLQLIQDPLFDHRYACVHGQGVHLVTVKFVNQMKKFIDDEENREDAQGVELEALSSSVCRNLMVWGMGEDDHSLPSSYNHLLGITFTNYLPQKLICVLQKARTVLFTVPHPNDIIPFEKEEVGVPGTSGTSQESRRGRTFLGVIKNILRPTTGQPFYCSEQDAGKVETVKLLLSSLVSKTERLEALEKCDEYFVSYLRALNSNANKSKKELQHIIDTRAEMKDSARRIAGAYEELCEEDELIQKRMDAVMLRYHNTFPVLTEKEKECRQKLEEIRRDLGSLKSFTGELHKKTLGQRHHQGAPKSVKLNPRLLEIIYEEIKTQQTIIANMKLGIGQVSDRGT